MTPQSCLELEYMATQILLNMNYIHVQYVFIHIMCQHPHML